MAPPPRKGAGARKRPHVCTFCGRDFINKTDLNAHLVKVHKAGELLKCNHCQEEFADKSNLERHIRSQHSGVWYVCIHCLGTEGKVSCGPRRDNIKKRHSTICCKRPAGWATAAQPGDEPLRTDDLPQLPGSIDPVDQVEPPRDPGFFDLVDPALQPEAIPQVQAEFEAGWVTDHMRLLLGHVDQAVGQNANNNTRLQCFSSLIQQEYAPHVWDELKDAWDRRHALDFVAAPAVVSPFVGAPLPSFDQQALTWI